jgi:uncharacterized protein
MKQLVEYIVSNLVSHPEDVVIEEEKTPKEEGSTNITIKVNPEDVGRVIGRSGKVINAIRQIARIAAIQKGIRVRVDLKDDGQPQPETTDESTVQESEQPEEQAPVEQVTEEPVANEAPTLEEEPQS